MSTAGDTSLDATRQSTSSAADLDPPRRRRRRWPVFLTVGVVLALACAVVVPWVWPQPAADPATTTPAAATAEVEGRTITAQQQVNGTLEYAGDFQMIGQLAGTVTDLPTVGTVIEPGEVLYRVDGEPVILLKGSTPAWRDLTWGTEGQDAEQINAALVALGYSGDLDIDPSSDTITWRSREAIKNLQEAFELEQTGVLDLGQVVFLPGPIRVTEIQAVLGAPVGAGQVVLNATSTRPQVVANVPVALAQQITAEDAVTVSMPDLSTADGAVGSVGTVATTPDGGTATVPVLITLSDPDAAAGLDQAPVLVAITTDTVADALVVPVTALLALAGGGYAVEVADEESTHLVPVELGLFDSGGGVVQVIGDDLQAGQDVVVPS